MKIVKKILLSIALIIPIILTLGNINTVNAESAGPIYLGIIQLRSSGYGYRQADKNVWKIAQYDSETDTTADTSKLIYCIKAGPGFGSTDMSSGFTPKISRYSQRFNLKDTASITAPYSSSLPTGTNYNKLIWVIDHLYNKVGKNDTTAREAYLQSVIPNEFYELLTDDDIDVVQQLAIWYFTNPDGVYHYEDIELYINSNAGEDANYKTFEDLYGSDYGDYDITVGYARQDAAKALYAYFIENASDNYSVTSPSTNPIELVKDNATMEKIGDNYVAGPYQINQLLNNVDYSLTATYKNYGTETTINPTIGVKDGSNNIVATNKTLKELIGQEFYLMMPTSSNIAGIEMSITTSYTNRTATYWSVENAPNTEQPVVMIEDTPYSFEDKAQIIVKIEKPFDLALRKFITKVNNVDITTRVPNVDISKLAAGTDTTATYNHPKDAIRVAIGDTVTYTIRVYNEGETDGYVEEITDHLPQQLEFVTDDPVNQEYEWTFASASDLKTLKTAYLSKANEVTTGANKIAAFNGVNLSYKDVKIVCKVVATDPMPSKITNIADITKFTDGEGNTVTDRDSQENNVVLPTGTELENYKDAEINRGEEYIPGQQDDDDFEKLILKEFDLSLRKFITNINGNDITDRIPNPDITQLKAGTNTTATYNHTKNPIKVAIGDTVTYTIRVYNEGEVDGYVEEITDHLPDQLEFLPNDETNKTYKWTADGTNSKIIKSTYLSKANETTTGSNKIAAFDGTTLSYKDVKIACKIVATDPMPSKITNIADITKFTDGNGNTVKDRDSEENNVQIPSDLPGYKDDEIEKTYVPGQQDDDDFEKVMIKQFDLALRKFITKVNDTEITNRVPNVDITKLAAGTDTTATYNHSKKPVTVTLENVVTYTIRVYNEGEVDGYVEEITDHLPDQLEFLPDDETNKTYKWTADGTNSKIVRSTYLSKANETTTGANKIAAFDGNKLSYKDVKIACKVVATDPMPSKITNIADITKFTDGEGNTVKDRDSQENNVQIPSDLPGYKDNEIDKEYVPGQQDDDDFEKLMLKEFDLSLRKFITKVNDTEITNRVPNVDITKLVAGTDTTATYNHSKKPIKVAIGDTVTYTIRVYNEGEVDGYVEEITDHLPDQLEFLPDDETNQTYKWTADGTNSKIVRSTYLSKANETTTGANKIAAFDGNKLSYKDIKIACKVVATDPMVSKITNIADITKFTDGEGNTVKDRDSQENNVQIPSDLPGYKDNEIDKEYVPGQQDDDDFEKVMIKQFDLALRKFITKVNDTEITDRVPNVDISKLAAGTETTATYNHSKNPVTVTLGNIVTYTIRVYNEGEVDGYVEEITDHLPDQLEFLPDDETNKTYKWTADGTNSKIVKSTYLSKANETTAGENKIAAFDGTTLSYKDVKIVCKVVATDPMVSKITNIADITKFTDGNGNTVKDRDSQEDNVEIPSDLPGYKDDEINSGEEYIPGQQDDDDFEKITLKEFDLALRKFITAVNTTEITDRYPVFSIDEEGKYIYTHTKEPVLVSNGNVVTYTIRVYNEGEVNGYAKLIKDDIPEGLEFLPDNDTNTTYRWKLLDEDGNETTDVKSAVSIVTDYLSKEQEKNPKDNLLLAFDENTMTEPDHKDVKVAFKVVESNTSDRIIINQAQISDDSGENGEDVTDKDSTPDEWNEGEDDQDIEKIKVQYFDLALRKWVTQAIIIENGETTVTETGHKAEDDPEDVVKVELQKKKISSVVVKFRYKIRVTNEGQIPGYVKEIKDRIPEGLKFVQADNPQWKEIESNIITTEQCKDVLLKPGESTEVEVLLTWINSDDNFGLKVNVAEISKDYNDFNAPDIDSTPDNNKEEEDDQDDAPVLLSVKTGQMRIYAAIIGSVLVIIAGGTILIKKYVL